MNKTEKREAAYAFLKDISCAHIFWLGFPHPCCLLVFFLINRVLLSGVFGCAGIVACTMFSHPRLGHTLFSNSFPPSLFALSSPPKLYRELHATFHVLSLHWHS